MNTAKRLFVWQTKKANPAIAGKNKFFDFSLQNLSFSRVKPLRLNSLFDIFFADYSALKIRNRNHSHFFAF